MSPNEKSPWRFFFQSHKRGKTEDLYYSKTPTTKQNDIVCSARGISIHMERKTEGEQEARILELEVRTLRPNDL